ncbi:hypothetical protein [Streptomyces sp. NPDC097640]
MDEVVKVQVSDERAAPAFGRNHERFLAKWPISPGSRIFVRAVEL